MLKSYIMLKSYNMLKSYIMQWSYIMLWTYDKVAGNNLPPYRVGLYYDLKEIYLEVRR